MRNTFLSASLRTEESESRPQRKCPLGMQVDFLKRSCWKGKNCLEFLIFFLQKTDDFIHVKKNQFCSYVHKGLEWGRGQRP